MFFYEDHSTVNDVKAISARVVLPSSVDLSVREARSKEKWTTEKNARKDAAFEAYIALYHAGLINDNLLPQDLIDPRHEEEFAAVEKRPNLAEVDQQISIWPHLAKQWQQRQVLHQNIVTLECAGTQWLKMVMLLPMALPDALTFPLYWDANHILETTVGKSAPSSWMENAGNAKEATHVVLSSVFANRMSIHQDDFMALFVPPLPYDNPSELECWVSRHSGCTKVSDIEAETSFEEDPVPNLNRLVLRSEGLIRDLSQDRAPHILLNLRRSMYGSALQSDVHEAEQSSDAPELLLAAKKFPKRADFLHQVANLDTQEQGLGIKTLNADTCEMDNLPWRMALFASLVPSILHVIHKTMLVSGYN